MKLHILTIALDAMPFLPAQFYTFQRLNIDWHWHIAEGVALPLKDTSWCKPIPLRLSRDGTTEFLNGIRGHPRVTIHQRQSWAGKTEMFNTMLENIKEECVLLQVDADEMWSADKISQFWARACVEDWEAYQFHCRYFVGPNIIITSKNTYGNRASEWVRAWKKRHEATFISHEPPILSPCGALADTRRHWPNMFDHYAYVYESQVRFKEQYYGYQNAVAHWRRLQLNKTWPVTDLKQFLPWVNDDATADLLHK